MLGKIDEIINNTVVVKLDIDINTQPNLVNLHVIFENEDEKVVGEIVNVGQKELRANIVGEIADGNFTPGSSSKPSFKSKVRLVNMEELELLLGVQSVGSGYTNFGTSNIYKGYKINVPINDFFSNHFAILGNSGAGKSCTVASIFQKLYLSSPTPPVNSSLFFFDAYGEYTNAFGKLNQHNSQLDYKVYTTNYTDTSTELLRIPIWLLDVDDFALLLDATNPAQLPIIEKMLKLVSILTGTSETVVKRKNDIIARALQDIMLSGMDSTKIRDQVIAILTKFHTNELNLNSQIVQPGYTRTLKQCLYIDKTGKMQEMELVVDFIRSYILEDIIEVPEEEKAKFYTLADLENALDFTLISEGTLKSDKVFDMANVLSVRLHTLATGDNARYFDYPEYITRDDYIKSLVVNSTTGTRCQITNFNINYVDDRLAKCFVKIISRMLFIKSSTIKPRGSRAFHIIIEEAHRYVQHDKDIELLGYNIFERITKEGRKYGCFLALITQRPSELSDTCISQCANFVILRTLHPTDLGYIQHMVPNVSEEVVLQLKNLKPGNCIAFGMAFKVPITMYIDLPDPRPLSNNVDLEDVWYHEIAEETATEDSGLILGSNTAQANQQMMAVQEVRPQQVQTANNSQVLGSTVPQPVAAPQTPMQQPPLQNAVQPAPMPQTVGVAPMPQQAQVLSGAAVPTAPVSQAPQGKFITQVPAS